MLEAGPPVSRSRHCLRRGRTLPKVGPWSRTGTVAGALALTLPLPGDRFWNPGPQPISPVRAAPQALTKHPAIWFPLAGLGVGGSLLPGFSGTAVWRREGPRFYPPRQEGARPGPSQFPSSRGVLSCCPSCAGDPVATWPPTPVSLGEPGHHEDLEKTPREQSQLAGVGGCSAEPEVPSHAHPSDTQSSLVDLGWDRQGPRPTLTLSLVSGAQGGRGVGIFQEPGIQPGGCWKEFWAHSSALDRLAM